MFDQFTAEGPPNLPYRELSREENRHLLKQMYYFLPFIRQTYEAIRRESLITTEQPINIAILNSIKELSLYYGSSLVFGDFDLKNEQSLIDKVFENAGVSKEELKKRILNIDHNRFNKADGELSDYFFGDITTDKLFTTQIPGGPLYSMGLSDGIGTFKQKHRFDLIDTLTDHLNDHSESLPISVLGNVARGVIDAAAIQVGLQRKKIKSSLQLYRVSSQTMQDEKPVVLDETFIPDSWGIAVDSFTAKGKSVPLSIKLMEDIGFKKRSVFLTHMGYEWAKELGVEYQWKSIHGEGNNAGTLLGGKMK